MKLTPVNDPREGQTIQCSQCFRMMPADQMLADLDGAAFKAYYCAQCCAGLAGRNHSDEGRTKA